MNDLVILKKDDVFTTSKVIADGTGIRHNKLINTINKYTEKVVGIKNRDDMSGIIKDCIAQGVEYHEIYKICQKKLEVFSSMICLKN